MCDRLYMSRAKQSLGEDVASAQTSRITRKAKVPILIELDGLARIDIIHVIFFISDALHNLEV